MNHRPLVFLDIETTGLSPTDCRVIEVGALRVENGAVVKTFQTLVQPGTNLPSIITKITGITDADLTDKPAFSAVAADLHALLDGAIFVAHNVDFDYGFLKAEYQRMGGSFNHDRLCTVKLSRSLNPNHRSHKLDAIIARGGYRVTDRHRAFDDAEVLYKFFMDSYDSHGLQLFKHMDRLVSYARKPAPRINPSQAKLATGGTTT